MSSSPQPQAATLSGKEASPASIPWRLLLCTLALFFIWSNAFIAISFLLGSERSSARLDWISLVAARYQIEPLICGLYCFCFRRAESLAILRAHGLRLICAGIFCIPAYNLALCYGQQHGIPAPIAALETTLAPLFLMLLGAAFLGERLSMRKLLGFAIALAGMALISFANRTPRAVSYPLVLAVTAFAPLVWSIFSIVSKPVTERYSPIVWTYLVVAMGFIPLAFLAPQYNKVLAGLDAPGWAALLYLSLLSTVFGFAAWNWILKYLPASSIGFTTFLSVPLTTFSKAVLAAALPMMFAFRIAPQEWLGGGIVLWGMAVALL